ncbi:MAG: YdjY domain-containing protein [Planctomycetota bacterium]
MIEYFNFLNSNTLKSFISSGLPARLFMVLVLLDSGSFLNAALAQDDPDPGKEPDSGQVEIKEMEQADIIDEETSDENANEPKSMEDVKKQIETEWARLLEVFESEGISVDREKKIVEVKGAIIRDKSQPQYPIEYVIVSERGNTHEAVILVKATPSNLNAALLSLGLEPGTTVQTKKKDPPPPKEEIEAGTASLWEIIPPTGTLVHIYVRYDGWEERPVRYLEDLLLDLRTGKPMDRVGWIYIGSRFARVLLGRDKVVKYMADMERNIVACYLTGFGNSIFDINNVDGVNDTLFDVNPDTAPPLHAQVTVIFSINPL